MDSNSQPLVSIVTPVHNGERFIAQSITSALAQTYQNWELIIVNNCSTDRTAAIVSSYAEQNPKIRVFNTDRLLTALQNHNHAVGHMAPASKYCKLLHADDWLFPQCLELMVRVAEAHPSVGIVGSYGLAGDRVVGDGIPYETEVVPGKRLAGMALLGGILPFYSPSSLLFRSDIVRQRNPFYDEASIHADHKACYETLRNHDFGFVHQVLTYIRKHDDSVTSSVALPLDMHQIKTLDLFLQYGPEFLTPHEFEKRREQVFQKYYRRMARKLIENRSREYWSYHRKEMRKLGYRFDTLRVIKGIAKTLLLHPKSALKFIRKSGKS